MKTRLRYPIVSLIISCAFIMLTNPVGAWDGTTAKGLHRPEIMSNHPIFNQHPRNHPPHSLKKRYHYGYRHYQTLSSAWNLLETGRSHQSLRLFGRAAKSQPSNGNPKIGYALAAAELGYAQKSVWAMRRALARDPDAFARLSGSGRLAGKIDHLAAQYHSGFQGINSRDASLMRTALLFLSGSSSGCREAAKQIKASADSSRSAKNLSRLIARNC